MSTKRSATSDVDESLQKSATTSSEQLTYTNQQGRTHQEVKKARKNVLALDKLPIAILECIIEYLHQPELLCLCLVSKAFYWPSYKRLYRQLTLVDAWYRELDGVPMRESNYFTIVELHQVEYLISTFKNNKKIASLVRTLNVTEMKDLEGVSNFPLLIRKLLARLSLESLYLCEQLDITQRILQKVQNFSFGLPLHSVKFPSNLVELKITYTGSDPSYELFQVLVSDLARHNNYRKLKKLFLKNTECRDEWPGEHVGEIAESGRPFWYVFFSECLDWGMKFNLTALGIDSAFSDHGNDEIAELVDEVVELSELDTIDITMWSVGSSQPHKDGSFEFLDRITRNTYSLRNLTICRETESPKNEMNALARILKENIPGQLKRLSINFVDQESSDSEVVRRSILEYQPNLLALRFQHSPFLRNCELFATRKFTGVPEIVDAERVCIDQLSLCQKISPEIIAYDECRPVFEERYFDQIVSHKKEILKFLHSDSIYNGTAEKLPLLKEYFVVGLCINMKERFILVNGQAISLEG